MTKATMTRKIKEIIKNAACEEEIITTVMELFDDEGMNLLEEIRTPKTRKTKASKPDTKPENNGWEKIAQTQLKNAYDWRMGEMENAFQDGHITAVEFKNWIHTDALDDIYHEAITTLYTGDSCGGKAPSEMRFAGKDFCYKYLISLFKKDGFKDIAESKSTEAKPAKTSKKSKKEIATTVQAVLKAFTGMKIGTYTAQITKDGYVITTKNGKEIEFNKDGTQKVDCKNAKFNNRLEIIAEA